MTRLRRIVLIALLALPAIAACGTSSGTPPASGLSQSQAIEAARQFAEPHSGSLAVDSARSGPFVSLGSGIVLQGVPSDHWVWAVTFTGSFPAGCASPSPAGPASAASPCPSAILTHDIVVIDYVDGRLLVSSLSP